MGSSDIAYRRHSWLRLDRTYAIFSVFGRQLVLNFGEIVCAFSMVGGLLAFPGCTSESMGVEGSVCKLSSEGGAIDGGTAGESLINHNFWEVTDAGQDRFGVPPAEVKCTDGIDNQAESLGGEFVYSISTVNLCDYLTASQPSLKALAKNDKLVLRFFHASLTAPIDAVATAAIIIGDDVLWQQEFTIPQQSELIDFSCTVSRDYPKGTPILFHVDNHGANEYALISLAIN